MKRIGLDVGGHTITAGVVDFSRSPAELMRAETVAAPSPRAAEPLVEAAAALVFPKELCPPAAHIFYTVSRFLSHGSLFCAGRPALFRRGRKVAGRL